MEEEFITIAETCKKLRISKPTLRKYIKEGKIKAVKFDRAVRIPKSQFLKEGKKTNEEG